ncbi:MAG: 2-amino-4-hydroxy-6-hydroxymethyldihydropteridine diphosphokinase [Muribaculaceae bacterium]|nr:2-amino-4-hydroxy-6-hydroxymethyldihydropteridine diphosphokinase [Muribaculaceae bacterium]
MLHVHINIGSNLGDREDNIRRAVASLRQLAVDVSEVCVSGFVTSPPWGYKSASEFLNVGISFDTDLTPQELLQATQSIEQSISTASHRAADGTYIDRLIDIDIIACATFHDILPDSTPTLGQLSHLKLMEIHAPELTLPHPRAHLRDFVISPLREIDPTLHKLLTERQL